MNVSDPRRRKSCKPIRKKYNKYNKLRGFFYFLRRYLGWRWKNEEQKVQLRSHQSLLIFWQYNKGWIKIWLLFLITKKNYLMKIFFALLSERWFICHFVLESQFVNPAIYQVNITVFSFTITSFLMVFVFRWMTFTWSFRGIPKW